MDPEKKDKNVEHIKAKLESAKEELKRRYGEPIEKIKAQIAEEEENNKDSWDNHKPRH
jgi:hypothetical protein